MAGNGSGYGTRHDVLVNRTADGVDLTQIFAEIQDANELYNQAKNAFIDLLTFPTTDTGAAVPQAGWGSDSFEEATEFGVPRYVGTANALKIGYTLKDFDLGVGYTWKFLRDATAAEVTAKIQRVYEADTKLLVQSVFRRLFDPGQHENEFGMTCYGLYNGLDGMVPPSHMGQTFDASTCHYLTTGSTTLDAADVEQSIKLIRRFGYGMEDGSRIIVLAHPDVVEQSQLASWRAGVEYVTGKKAKYDFVASSNAPAFWTDLSVVGKTPEPDYNGLPVTGSYGGALIVETHFMPTDYVAVFATGGPGSEKNVIGLRSHANPSYQGLRQIPGNNQAYPLIDSYFQRTFGTGVRHRGAAVALQITTAPGYFPPQNF